MHDDDLDRHGLRLPVKLVNYAERPNPSFVTYGPKNRRQFLNLANWSGGEP